MNRSLTIPAVCCLVAFVGLLAALRGAPTNDPPVSRSRSSTVAVHSVATSGIPREPAHTLLSPDEARDRLTVLSGEYLRPWKQWEQSPRRLYSRIAPRPIPSLSAEVEMTASSTGSQESFVLAVIKVTRQGDEPQQIPCIVDRATSQVRLFAEGQWLTGEEWLMRAPTPS
jgi:hypothetical protein